VRAFERPAWGRLPRAATGALPRGGSWSRVFVCRAGFASRGTAVARDASATHSLRSATQDGLGRAALPPRSEPVLLVRAEERHREETEPGAPFGLEAGDVVDEAEEPRLRVGVPQVEDPPFHLERPLVHAVAPVRVEPVAGADADVHRQQRLDLHG